MDSNNSNEYDIFTGVYPDSETWNFPPADYDIFTGVYPDSETWNFPR